MLRHVILLAAFAGICVAFPILFGLDPGAFDSDREAVMEVPAAKPAKAKPAAAIAVTPLAEPEPSAQPLLGRRMQIASNEGGHFVAEFRLNGRRTDAMVDTGATTVALNQSLARRIGISLSPSDFTYQVRTANGTAKAAMAIIDRVDIGRITLERVEALVLEDRALDGVLVGMSFLNRLSKFQVQDGMLTMQQ